MAFERSRPLVLAVAILSLTPGAATARTYVNDGTGHPSYRPRHMLGGSGVACGVWQAKRLHWRHWGETTARASGTVMVHVGDSCAGELKPFRATFRLSQPRSHCKLLAGSDAEPKPVRQRLFTRVDIHMAGADGTWHTTPDQPGACRRPRVTSQSLSPARQRPCRSRATRRRRGPGGERRRGRRYAAVDLDARGS
jgi:hypothetical protein